MTFELECVWCMWSLRLAERGFVWLRSARQCEVVWSSIERCGDLLCFDGHVLL